MGNLLTTYALLGYLKEVSNSATSITELYIPLVKKALADYSAEYGLTEYKGRSLSEIANKIRSIFGIEIPIPILYKIMSSIRDEVNNDNEFAFYNDGSFIIKTFVFNDINETIEQESNNIQILKDDYYTYCQENGYKFDFDELNNFILSSQIEMFTNVQPKLADVDYYIPKYISERFDNSEIFRIISNVYLGGIIVSYLEQNITKPVTETELLLDTNFITSLIDLNTENAYQTCNQLFVLGKKLGYRFTILNSTINQIKILLSNRINDFAGKDFYGSIKCADVFNACIRRGLNKTDLERIKDNLLQTIQDNGIVVIQDAQIRGILEKAKKTSDYKELLSKRRNEDSALNDTVAKLYVENKRGENVREFVDVKCWFLHNSYSTNDCFVGRKIYERYLISASELLVLLWLSSPALGNTMKMTDLARCSLSAYVTKYRRCKTPSHEILRIIKKRIDDTSRLGVVTEKDTFNLCIRMAEGHLTHSEIVESLVEPSLTDEQFATKLKNYSAEVDSIKEKQKQNVEEKITSLQDQLNIKDEEIHKLRNEMSELLKQKYLENREAYVNYEIKKVKHETFWMVLAAIFIIFLWVINEFFHNILSTGVSSLISFLLFFATTFGILFFNQTSIRDFICRKEMRKRLMQKYDSMNK